MARASGYALIAELLRHGPTARTLPALRELPELGDGVELHDDLDRHAATHQRVLGREVPPMQGAFLDPRGRGGGLEAERLMADLGARGPGPRSSDPPDHASVLLDGLADACAAADDEAQVALLGGHLLRWLPPLVVALERAGEALYANVATQLVALGAHHAAALSVSAGALPEVATLPELLERPETDLRRVSDALVTPAVSGWWLSHGALDGLGRAVGLPAGFGRRRDRVLALIGGAAEAARLPALIATLDGLADAWGARYEALGAAPWAARMARTRAGLLALGGRASP